MLKNTCFEKFEHLNINLKLSMCVSLKFSQWFHMLCNISLLS